MYLVKIPHGNFRLPKIVLLEKNVHLRLEFYNGNAIETSVSALLPHKMDHGWLLALQDPHLTPAFRNQFTVPSSQTWITTFFFLPKWKDVTVWVFTCANHKLIFREAQERQREPYITDFHFLFIPQIMLTWLLSNFIERNFQRISIYVLSTFSELDPSNGQKNHWAIKNWTAKILLSYKSPCLRILLICIFSVTTLGFHSCLVTKEH